MNLEDYIYSKKAVAEGLTELPKAIELGYGPFVIGAIMQHIASGLDFIHRHKHVHRDLNPQNSIQSPLGPLMSVLYSSATHAWKIADFGLACSGTMTPQTTTSGRGKQGYRPPELLKEPKSSFTQGVDLFALGCVFYELVFGKKAFSSDLEILQHYISNSDYSSSTITPAWMTAILPSNFSLSKILNKMMARDFRARSSVREICPLLVPLITPNSETRMSWEERALKIMHVNEYLNPEWAIGVEIPTCDGHLERFYFAWELYANRPVGGLDGFFSRQTAVRKSRLGLSHPLTEWSYLCASAILQDLANEVRREHLQAILDMITKMKAMIALEEYSIETLSAALVCTNFYSSPQEKMDSLAELLKLSEEKLGRKHPTTLSCMWWLGATLLELGEYNAAEWLISVALGEMKNTRDQDHPEVLQATRYLLWVRNLLKHRLDGNIHGYMGLIERETKLYGRYDRRTLVSLRNLGQTYYNLNDQSNAIRIFREIHEPWKRLRGPNGYGVIEIERVLSTLSQSQTVGYS